MARGTERPEPVTASPEQPGEIVATRAAGSQLRGNAWKSPFSSISAVRVHCVNIDVQHLHCLIAAHIGLALVRQGFANVGATLWQWCRRRTVPEDIRRSGRFR